MLLHKLFNACSKEDPPPELEAELHISKESVKKLVSFISFVMSAFVCNPKTSGLANNGNCSLKY